MYFKIDNISSQEPQSLTSMVLMGIATWRVGVTRDRDWKISWLLLFIIPFCRVANRDAVWRASLHLVIIAQYQKTRLVRIKVLSSPVAFVNNKARMSDNAEHRSLEKIWGVSSHAWYTFTWEMPSVSDFDSFE